MKSSLRNRALQATPASLLILVLLLAPAAFAGRNDDHEGRRLQHLTERLQLSDEQQATIKAHREAGKGAHRAVREAIRAKKGEMDALWAASTPNRAAILAKSKEIHALKGQMAEARIDGRLQMLAVLTPAQKVDFLKMKSERSERGRGGKGHRRGPPI